MQVYSLCCIENGVKQKTITVHSSSFSTLNSSLPVTVNSGSKSPPLIVSFLNVVLVMTYSALLGISR